MSSKTPVRATFSGSNVTGLAEYQSGEFIPLTHGGLGASLSIGSAQILAYNGTAWVNEYEYENKGKVPFTKTDGSLTHISMTNNKDMTTINGFLDHVVTQSFYMPFTNASGTAVTTMRPGHMPELSEI